MEMSSKIGTLKECQIIGMVFRSRTVSMIKKLHNIVCTDGHSNVYGSSNEEKKPQSFQFILLLCTYITNVIVYKYKKRPF